MNTTGNGSTTVQKLIVIVSFVIGTVGNIAALCILYRSPKTRNRKHVLMLTCLALNDLVAEVGMLTMLFLKNSNVSVNGICAGYVLLRAFGLGSGCVAFIMAFERWLALTRPFLYHQLVTYQRLKIAILVFWSLAALWTYLPLVGFGLYQTEDKCSRYRDAKEIKDKIYAFLFLAFGGALCFCITLFNVSLVMEFSGLSRKRVLVRRISRSTINNRLDGITRYQTPEEIAFAKLMGLLCFIFVICWGPQMVFIPLVQFFPEKEFVKRFANMPDVLMGVYFTLDPYVYVLYRYFERGKCTFPCCFKRRSMSSIPTTTATGTPTSVLLNPPSFPAPRNNM